MVMGSPATFAGPQPSCALLTSFLTCATRHRTATHTSRILQRVSAKCLDETMDGERKTAAAEDAIRFSLALRLDPNLVTVSPTTGHFTGSGSC